MKRILYLGTDPTNYSHTGELIHYPVIKIVPLNPKDLFDDWERCTHLVITSKHAARLFAEHLRAAKKTINQEVIAVGTASARALEKEKIPVNQIAREETQEGIIELLEKSPPPKNAFFYLPRSARSRPLLTDYLARSGYSFKAIDLYDTHFQKPGPLPDLEQFDEIIFTSPSTVDGFCALELKIPEHVILTAIGPVTQLRLSNFEIHQICTPS